MKEEFEARKGAARPRRKSASEELILLDRDLVKLLARRAGLVTRMRGGRGHAATPDAIKAEKRVREAWESEALAVSRDVRFVRKLYDLLQDLEVRPRELEKAPPAYNLAPARKPVRLDIPGPSCARSATLWAALYAAKGLPVAIRAMRDDLTEDCLKALNQAGAALSRPNAETLENKEHPPLAFAGKTLYAGESPLVFYLLAFLSLEQSGKVRFTGGAALKSADFSALRNFLPQLGARLSHTVPGSKGLPAGLEISGLLPRSLIPPADLPPDALLALILAALTWSAPVTLDFSALPQAPLREVLVLLDPLLKACGIKPAERGLDTAGAKFTQAGLVRPPLDALLCAPLLALPAFTGGKTRLRGTWPEDLPLAIALAGLLESAGLKPRVEKDTVQTEAEKPGVTLAGFDHNALPPELHPLYLALLAQEEAGGQGGGLTDLRLPGGGSAGLAREFLGCLGQATREALAANPETAPAFKSGQVWVSPGPLWSLAYALCAFFRPGLKLANPGEVSAIYPLYWAIFNGLPEPDLSPKAPKVEEAAPKRRRVKTSAFIDLTDIPSEPDTPR